MGELTFLKSGLLTTMQDMGRYGFKKYGVPHSGVMDQRHAQLANLLVNNSPNLPVLEITFSGPEMSFSGNALIAIAGADLSPQLDGKHTLNYTPLLVNAGQILSFGKPKYGVRAYLAVRGGFRCEEVLGSCSQYATVTSTSKVTKGFKLFFENSTADLPNATVKSDMDFFTGETLSAYPGPEYNFLIERETEALSGRLTIGDNNRMGYQLNADKLIPNEYSIITAPVMPGTVQLTPSGRLIVLMRDAQVTGGYPRVLQLAEDSINRLAQKHTGQKVRFHLMEYEL